MIIVSDKTLNNDFMKKYNIIDLNSISFKPCRGCLFCWIKTPTHCVYNDDLKKLYPQIANEKNLIYIFNVKYGSYSPLFKSYLERLIPIQQPFIRIHDNETHHFQRNVVPKTCHFICYGNIDNEEKEIFKNLVERNILNMNINNYTISFTSLDNLEKTIIERINNENISN